MESNKKRSQGINLDLMQKQPWIKAAKMSAAVTAATITLSGCSDNQGYVYQSVDECNFHHPGKEELCQAAYDEAVAEALRTGPKYQSQAECAQDFGLASCQYNGSSNFWGPFIAGYMVSEVIDEVGDYFEYKSRMKRYNSYSSPIWSTRQGYYVDASGSSYGRQGTRRVSTWGDSFDKKSTSTKSTTKTMSRGGFGSTVAKTSSSSSRSSWGG